MVQERFRKKNIAIDELQGQQRKKRLRRRIFYLALILLISAAFFAVCVLVFFNVGEIELVGLERCDAAAVREALGVSVGDNMFSFRAGDVESALKKAFPPLRRLSMRLASSRAASVLAMMLSSGFPLEQALEMVPLVLPDEEAAGEIAQIREKMGEGVSFSDALTGSRLFDEIHRQMLRMGIAAGREDQVMAKIAETYEQQAEEGISDLVSIIEPTMVAALSIVIGAVLLSVMMPMAGIISSIL